MRYKLALMMLAVLIILSGCINTDTKDNTTGQLIPEKMLSSHYVDRSTILNGEDFPGFKLENNVYYISPENLSLTLETEVCHNVYEMNSSAEIMPGYRIYGDSELYSSKENSTERYMLVQYKTFDNNESMADTINMTAEEIYVKHGYKHVSISRSYNENVVVLESNVTNHTDMNVTIILFGFDTVIGKVGVQDSKDKSLNESLKVLDIVFSRIHVKTKEVKAARLDLIRTMPNTTNGANIPNVPSRPDVSNVPGRSNVSNQ
jgi:hypothetical protein